MPSFMPSDIVATVTVSGSQNAWPVTYHVCKDPREESVYYITDTQGDTFRDESSELSIDDALRCIAYRVGQHLARS